MKKKIHLFVFVVLTLLALLGTLCTLKTLKEEKNESKLTNITLKQNEILIPNYCFYYLRCEDCHHCRGTQEWLTFIYKNTSFIVISKAERKGPTYEYFPEMGECEIKGTPMNLYTVGMNLSKDCTFIYKNYDTLQYSDVGINCSSPLKLQILNTTIFNLCLQLENCTLIHGIDIKIVPI